MSKVFCSKYSFFMPNLHIQMINETVAVVTWAFVCVRFSGVKTTYQNVVKSCREKLVQGGGGLPHLSPSRAPQTHTYTQ